MIKYSIIVTSANKFDELNNLLFSLNYSALEANIIVETILVLQTDAIFDFINSRISLFTNISIKLTRTDLISLSKARNIGVNHSSGEWLIIIDDDAYIDLSFFKVFNNLLASNKFTVIAGKLLECGTNMPLLDIYVTGSKFLDRKDFRLFMGSAHFISKSVFDKIGNYNENLGAGTDNFSGEESELFFRIIENNYEVYYIDSLIIYHPSIKNQPVNKQVNYLKGQGAVARIAYNLYPNFFINYNFLFLKPILGYIYYSFVSTPNNSNGFKINLRKLAKLLEGFFLYR